MSVLYAENLHKRYRTREVVCGLSLHVESGEIVGLLGPNGAGKTTTFYMIVGLVRPDGGEVTLGSETITELPMYLRAKQGISYLPQEASVFRKLTVEENLFAVFETMNLPRAERERRERRLGRGASDVEGEVEALLERLRVLLDGPCGVAVDGKCEVDRRRDCGWQRMFDRLRERGRLDKLEVYRDPKNNSRWSRPRSLDVGDGETTFSSLSGKVTVANRG